MSFSVDCRNPADCCLEIQKAASLLKNGELVAFPTETVYGLGANALDESAVGRIFASKGRPSDNPLIVHVHSISAAKELTSEMDHISAKLAEAFWPGPLTIILPLNSRAGIARNVSAGLETVGIRVPDHPVALALLRECRLPLAAPSANKSGSPSPTTAFHVSNDLGESAVRPALILDGGPCRVGLESTVVQVKDKRVHILRPGGVSAEDISETLKCEKIEVVNSFSVELGDEEAPRAPGMKYRHYAPSGAVIVADDVSQFSPFLEGDVLICFDTVKITGVKHCLSLGNSPEDLESACSRLFDLFRTADSFFAKRIVIDCSFDKNSGLGAALWNRISKASSRGNS